MAFAKRTLLSGFTTIRDAGGTVVPSLRNAINAGTVEGPRIVAASGSGSQFTEEEIRAIVQTAKD